MFDQTFIDGTQKKKTPFAFAISVVIEIWALGVLVLIALVYTQALPNAQLRSLLTAPRSPVTVARAAVQTEPHSVTAPRRFSAALIAPKVIPHQINTNIQELQPAPEADTTSPTAIDQSNAATNDLLYRSFAPAPEPPPPAPKKTPGTPIRVATGVAEANLIHKVMPVYPPLARSARVQGTVEFTAIINKEGRIENLQLLRGHPLLVQAAKEAVLQWSYRPTLLNGQPVEVVTDIIVNFTLSQ